MTSEIGATGAPAAQTPSKAPGGNLGKDEFLKMLVAQMRNQDPLSPMKGDEMAAQLAQFSSLEQLTNLGEGMQDLLELTGSMGGEISQAIHSTTGIGLVGRTVLAQTDRIEVGGERAPELAVDLAKPGVTARLRVYDASGREVGSRELGPLAAGRTAFELGSAAEGLPAGVYTFRVDVANGAGEAVDASTFVKARVDGVRYGPEGPTLISGGLALPMAKVLEVTGA